MLKLVCFPLFQTVYNNVVNMFNIKFSYVVIFLEISACANAFKNAEYIGISDVPQ